VISLTKKKVRFPLNTKEDLRASVPANLKVSEKKKFLPREDLNLNRPAYNLQ
jgi:hypothetical protein